MKKGETLVEVLISIAVFLIIFAGLITCILGMSNLNRRQLSYVYFENICRNIDFYVDAEAKNWDSVYFGVSNPTADEENRAIIYYNDNFAVCQENEQRRYQLEYYYDSNGDLIISVQDIVKDYAVISALNYGAVAGGQP